jgi:uncharacterized protein (DUF2141 family)
MFYTSILASSLISCANPLSPPGGPDDKIPPEILESYPKNASLHYKGEPITLKFSEYVDRASVVDNIKISPSLPLEFSWSGKTLEIRPADTLKANITYCLNLAANYKDLSGNSPKAAFSTIFSTGDKIDSGKIVGRAFYPANSYSVFAYALNVINPDTLNFEKTKPDYKTTIGTSGSFELQALKNGKYRLAIVNDRNQDDLYNQGYEEYSSSIYDIEVSDDAKTKPANFYKSKIFDFIAPQINDAEALNSRTIKLQFSEPIDTFSLSNKSFSIVDSSAMNSVKVLAAYISNGNGEVNLISESDLAPTAKYFVNIDNSENSIKDSVGNSIKGIVKSPVFIGSDISYLSKAELGYKCSLADSSKKVSLEPEFRFAFNSVIKTIDIDSVALYKSGDSIVSPMIKKIINNSIVELKPLKLKSASDYELKVKIKNCESFGGAKLADTSYALRFSTDDYRFRGYAGGRIARKDSLNTDSSKYIIILKSAKDSKVYAKAADDSLHWAFSDMPEGEYSVEVFKDLNKNGKYDSGSAFPYLPAEPFFIVETRINIMQRWKLEDIIIRIDD